MKLKMYLIPCALFASSLVAWGEGAAPVHSTNIHAMVKVLSRDANTIIAVPWMFYTPTGAATTSLPVDHLVRPTNLTLGDFVLVHLPDPNDSRKKTFVAWQLTKTSEPVPGVANPSAGNDRDWCWKWEPVMTASRFEQDNNGKTRTDVWLPEEAELLTENRGYGVWLLRQNPVDGNGTAVPFYLYGQWTTGEAEVTIKGGSDAAPVCTLLANPDCVHPTDVNQQRWTNVGATDTLILTTDGKTTLYCTYQGGSWGYSKQTKVKKGKVNVIQTTRVPAPEVPAGTGFWYVRRSSEDVKLKWADPFNNEEGE